jgi:hypothetical protein
MPLNRIRKEDIDDNDFVDAYELISDGYGVNSIYLSTTCVSTTSGTKTVVINLASDSQGIYYSIDHPAQPNDIVWISGTSGGAGDGYFTIATIVDDVTFTINETIGSSTGGNVRFQYRAGAANVGYDSRGDCVITHNTVQEALKDLDTAICNQSGGLTPSEHETLRQLIHLADGAGGPYEGFPTNAYRETLPTSDPFPTSVIWWTSAAKVAKYVEKFITYNGNKTPATIQWKAYGTDGVTLLATVTDTITYSGVFELYRVRGIVDSLPISDPLTVEAHKYVRQLIHLADGVGGPFEGFASGAYRETLPTANAFPTSIIWYNDNTKALKIVEKTIAYNTNKTVSLVSWKVYDTDGTTVLATVSDTPTYTGIFENDRTRAIS